MLDAIIILVASVCFNGYDWETFNVAMDIEWNVTTMVTCSDNIDYPGFQDMLKNVTGAKQLIIVRNDYPGPPGTDGYAYVWNNTAYVRGNITYLGETVNHEFLHLWLEDQYPDNIECWSGKVHLHVIDTKWIADNVRVFRHFGCGDPNPWGF